MDAVARVLRSPGAPLPTPTRNSMEEHFGEDFRHVRIHDDARAAESARSVNALAYTVGPHVAFDHGQYTPETTEGRRLLAHELTHVVQQSRRSEAVTPPTDGLFISDPSDGAERAADRVAEHVTGGSPAMGTTATVTPVSQVPDFSSSILHRKVVCDPQNPAACWDDEDPLKTPVASSGVRPPIAAGMMGPTPLNVPGTPMPPRVPFPPPSPNLPEVPVNPPGPPVEPPGPGLPNVPWYAALAALATGPVLVGAAVAAAILTYSTPTAPPWMDETNPITGLGYTSEEEYKEVHRMTDEEKEAARNKRRQRVIPPIVPGVDYDETPEEAAKRDPCDLQHPGMPKCQAIAESHPHSDVDSAYKQAIESLPPERRQGPWVSPGAEAPGFGEGGSHTTWWSDDRKTKFTVICLNCCETVEVGGIKVAIVRQRCRVDNVEFH